MWTVLGDVMTPCDLAWEESDQEDDDYEVYSECLSDCTDECESVCDDCEYLMEGADADYIYPGPYDVFGGEFQQECNLHGERYLSLSSAEVLVEQQRLFYRCSSYAIPRIRMLNCGVPPTTVMAWY